MKVCRVTACVLAAVLFMAAASAAQTVTGEIRGTVRDSSGGVLPGVTVTVTNTKTGLTRTETYERHRVLRVPEPADRQLHRHRRAPGLPQGGANGLRRSRPMAASRPTSRWASGPLTETVTVEAIRGDTVNRTSGEVQRVVDGETVRSLALSGRNYLELASLIPGAMTTDDDQMATMTGLGTGGTVINGNRGNSNSLTVDGGFNLDSGSNASMINNVSIDFIDQVAIQTSNFAADKGRNAGASINVVTKSGTNRFSGSLMETYRNDKFHSANYFAPRDPSGNRIKAKENFHNYGGGLGGPIVKNKLFFFTGMEFRSLDRQESPQRRTLPTRAELQGNFSARILGPDGVAGTTDDNSIPDSLRNPATGLPFANHTIPPSLFTADGRAIASVYDRMIGLAAEYNDAPVANNTTFQLDFPFDWRQDLVRVDYRRSASQCVLRALPARQLRPDRAARDVHRRRDADDSDQPRAAGLRRPGRAHLDRPARTCSTTSRPRRRGTASGFRRPVRTGCATPTASSSRRCTIAAATTSRAFRASRSAAPAHRHRSSARRRRCCRRRPTSRSRTT